jgi:hypothetical protein
VHYAAAPLGSWWALTIGGVVAIAWSGVLLLARLRSMQRISGKI